MAGISLKKGIRLNADSTGAVLVDTDLCRTVRLSPLEAKILQLCDGKRASEEILVESRKSDKSLDLARVQDVLGRFKQKDFLKDPAELSEAAIEVDLDVESPMSTRRTDLVAPLLSDRAPRLRSDLQIRKKPTGELGLLDVTDPRTGRTFTLYDFEVSIARMLNGERKVVEVIEAAAKIGIPVTLESFQKFIRQIEAYGFVAESKPAEPDAHPEGQTTWRPRQEWSEEIRQLFQSALKMFRLKRYSDARNYVDAILAIDSKIEEASEMLKRIESASSSLDAVVAEADTSSAAVDASPNFEDLYGDALPSKEAKPPPPDYRTRTAERSVDRASGRRRRLIVGGAIAAAAAAAALYPFPRVLQVEARVAPIYEIALRAPRAGTIRALFVHERQWVTAGTKLLELDARSAAQKLEGAEKNFQKAIEDLRKFEDLRESEEFTKFRLSTDALRTDLDKLRTERERMTSKRKSSRVTRLNKRIRSVEAKLRRSEEAMVRMAPDSREPELRRSVDQVRQERELLQKEVASAAVLAPHEGIVVGLPETKAEVSSGQIVSRIQDISLLKATLRVADGDAHLMQNDQPISLSAPNLPRQEFKGRVSVVSGPERMDGNFEAIVNNPEKLSLDATGKVTIQCGKQSFGQLLVQRMKRLTTPSLHAALR